MSRKYEIWGMPVGGLTERNLLGFKGRKARTG